MAKRKGRSVAKVNYEGNSDASDDGGKDSQSEELNSDHNEEANKDGSVSDTKNLGEEEEYEVEKIVGDRFHDGKQQYLVRWKGFDGSQDTWEDESNLDCDNLLKEYRGDESAAKGKKKGRAVKKKQPPSESIPLKKRKSEMNSANKDEFEIEKIIEMHTLKTGKREFLIRWTGYSSKDDTWEPEKNLEGTEILEKFLLKVQKAKECEPRQLRVNRQHTDVYAPPTNVSKQRHSKRNSEKQRVKYYEAE